MVRDSQLQTNANGINTEKTLETVVVKWKTSVAKVVQLEWNKTLFAV